MEYGCKGKHVCITGGTSGIGLAVARTFVQDGARVLVVGRNASKGAQVVQELAALAGQITAPGKPAAANTSRCNYGHCVCADRCTCSSNCACNYCHYGSRSGRASSRIFPLRREQPGLLPGISHGGTGIFWQRRSGYSCDQRRRVPGTAFGSD